MNPKPPLSAVVFLRCPQCNQSPLRKPNSWFQFNLGCPNCKYLYEREPGYFWGAAWMINYPMIGVSMLATGGLVYSQNPEVSTTLLSASLSLSAVLGGLLIWPFGRALWMWLDHWIHPISEEDRLNYQERSTSSAPIQKL